MPNDEYLIDSILPSREIHFLAGPSGSGKSTFLFQFLDDWSRGERVLGHSPNPVPYVYVSCDRSLASVHRTINRVGTTPPQMMMSVVDDRIETMEGLDKHILTTYPSARFIILDGIVALTPQGKVNDYQIVSSFLKSRTRWCQTHNRTILGIGHSAKTKEGETYLSPRERIIGSVAWGGFSETVIFIEPAKAEDTGNKLRYLHLLPRNSREERFEMELDNNGRLVPAQKRPSETSKILTFINSLSPGGEFTFDEIYHLGEMSKQYVSRTLARMTEKGEIVRLNKGVYAVAYPTPPL